MFQGFSAIDVRVNGTAVHAVRGGAGPPVLLLHGYPQTHVMWHRVAPMLAERFTVVCSDLRGYGDSAKPGSDEKHEAFSKRVMAQDQVELMAALGFARFAVVGHDRGGRVARRLALDRSEAISGLVLLDIVPTETMYGSLDQARAMMAWRFFFLTQPPDLPERLIGSHPDFYLRWTLDEWCGTPGAIAQEALSEYRRCFDQAMIHSSCEDYRAGASIDLAHDRASASQRIQCPVLVLWSDRGIGSSYDPLAIWRGEADEVRGHGLDCGHFLAEERPEEVGRELVAFLGDQTAPKTRGR
jgi:haloacetate dehalogenase